MEHITDETAESYFERASHAEFLILKNSFPIILNRYLDKKANENYTEIKKKAERNVISFNKFEFANQIKAVISTGSIYKPGDDDRFWAEIIAVYPRSEDPYLKKITPYYSKETYSERGLRMYWSMEGDYNQFHRENDELELPKVQEELQTNFLNRYNFDIHVNELTNQYIIDFKNEILKKLSNTNGFE